MATVGLSIVGGIIAGPVGAYIGAAVGSVVDGMIAQALAPTSKVEGPRLNDLNVTSAEPGGAIPLVWGTMRLGGQVIWSSKLREVKKTKKSGGKGGGGGSEQTTYTYNLDCAVAVCDGPIYKITKIMADKKVLYTESGGRSSKRVKDIRIYRGTETQGPDSLLESETGQKEITTTTVGGLYTGAVTASWDAGGSGGTLQGSNTTGQLSLYLTDEDALNAFYASFSSFNDIFGSVCTISGLSNGSTSLDGTYTILFPMGNLITLLPHTQDLPGYSVNFSDSDITLDARREIRTVTTVPGTTPAYRGIAYVVFQKLQLADFGNRLPTFNFFVQESASGSTNVREIAGDILLRGGLAQADFRLENSMQFVQGYAIRKRTSAREVLSNLTPFYDFTVLESGYRLILKDRNRVIDAMVEPDDLAATPYEDDPVPAREITRKQEYEMPREVLVKFINPKNNYQMESVASRRLITESENVASMEFPIAITPTEARERANTILGRAFTERMSETWHVPAKYLSLDGGDIVILRKQEGVVDDNPYGPRWRVTNSMLGMNGVIEMTVSPDTLDWQRVIETFDPGYEYIADNDGEVSLADAVVMDLPLLFDPPSVPDAPGLLIGGKTQDAATNDPNDWPGGLIYSSLDDTDYGEHGVVGEAVVTGTVVNTLGDGPTAYMDRLNTLDVVLDSPYHALESVGYETLLRGRYNIALVGDELIAFETATQTSAAGWTLRGLLRGMYSTNHQTRSHAQYERFILLDTASLAFAQQATERIGAQIYAKCGTFGTDLLNADPSTITLQANTLKPWSPVHITRSGDTVTWTGRARHSNGWINGAGVPQVEESEKYELELVRADGTVRIDTVTGLTSFTYPSGELSAVSGGGIANVTAETYTHNADHPATTAEMDQLFANAMLQDTRQHAGSINWSGSRAGYSTNFAWRAYGDLYAPEDGEYTFGVNSDDASDLLIYGQMVTSWYGGHGTGSYRTGTVRLSKGWHRFEARMEQRTGGAALIVAWQTPSAGSLSIIPATGKLTIYQMSARVGRGFPGT